MSVEQNKALVRKVNEEVYNQGNLDFIDVAFGPDYVSHDLSPHQVNARTLEANPRYDPMEFKRNATLWHSAFPDSHMTIDQLMAEGNRVMCWTTFSGTQTGEWFGIAPTGKHVTYTSFSVLRIADGKIAERWALWDRLGFFQQIGVAPETRVLLEQTKRPLLRQELIATGHR